MFLLFFKDFKIYSKFTSFISLEKFLAISFWNLLLSHSFWGFPDSSVNKESACNAGDPSLIPGSGRSAGEGIGYPLQYSWASLVAQLVKNPPAMRETWVWSLGWEDPLEKGKAAHSSVLAWRIPWTGITLGYKELDTTEWLSFHFTCRFCLFLGVLDILIILHMSLMCYSMFSILVFLDASDCVFSLDLPSLSIVLSSAISSLLLNLVSSSFHKLHF